jgi:hypothetical protein
VLESNKEKYAGGNGLSAALQEMPAGLRRWASRGYIDSQPKGKVEIPWRRMFPEGCKEDAVLKRALKVLVFSSLAVGMAWGAENPFVGDWKLNSSMSRMPDEMKVESKGGNRYSFNFGGGDETIVADGTDQPAYGGTTLSAKADAADTWIVERKEDGRLLLRATWKLSKDGGRLTDFYREFESDGSTVSMDYVYQRSGEGSGFAADWRSIKETMNSPYGLQVKAYQGDGLSLIFTAQQRTKNLKLDGKEYPKEGPNARPDSSFSSRRVDERTLEMTDKAGGEVIETREIRVSPDGKTLTMTVHGRRRNEPEVLVFDRE